jgi:hypothetical protein
MAGTKARMTKNKLKNFISIIQKGQKAIKDLPFSKRKALEKVWDVEHAYYSSSLEGSKIDRKQFEKFAENLS